MNLRRIVEPSPQSVFSFQLFQPSHEAINNGCLFIVLKLKIECGDDANPMAYHLLSKRYIAIMCRLMLFCFSLFF